MPVPSPFHTRTAPLCHSHEWRNWSGFLAASVYEHSHEREYYAIRNAAALIDVSPLYKYHVTGPGAQRLLDRVVTRDVKRCAVGQVLYTPWCDEDGFLIDDGTLARLDQQQFRLTAADPTWRWLADCGAGLDVQVDDVTEQIAALALQGPLSRHVLQAAAPGAGLDGLRYFRLANVSLGGVPVTVTRTGYTGDLGYEVWMPAEEAEPVWDALVQAGQPFGLLPAGMAALDIARVEAGLLLIDVDYIAATRALIAGQKSTPYDVGLDWTVALDKGDFVGRRALRAELERGSVWKCVGLEVDWPGLEALYGRVGLVPRLAGRASRAAVPVYQDGEFIGQATSSAFSPILKQFIAIATLKRSRAILGARVDFEVTIEYERHKAPATVVKLPFFDPPRKRA
ncbi:MAG: aminomethyl transferase family protein [Caldilineaceae bacterium]|nr:aminomethyl transferase family protein [Caldilineaceae bacterium]